MSQVPSVEIDRAAGGTPRLQVAAGLTMGPDIQRDLLIRLGLPKAVRVRIDPQQFRWLEPAELSAVRALSRRHGLGLVVYRASAEAHAGEQLCQILKPALIGLDELLAIRELERRLGGDAVVVAYLNYKGDSPH
jgi:hypothetical protein